MTPTPMRWEVERAARLSALVEHAGLDPARVLASEWSADDPIHAVVTVVDSFDPLTTHEERICRPDTGSEHHVRCSTERHERIGPTRSRS